jgi:hypothetical protein
MQVFVCKREEGVGWLTSTLEVRGLTGHPIDGAVFQLYAAAALLPFFQSILPRHSTPTQVAQISTPYPPPIEVKDESSGKPGSQCGRNTCS